jgi:hypothetical protein
MFKYFLLMAAVGIRLGIALIINEPAIADVFKSGKKIYINDLAENAKIEIKTQRISYRKLVPNNCKALVFKTTQSVELLEIENKIIDVKTLRSRPFRACSDKIPNTDSYRDGNNFWIAQVPQGKSYLIKIISPDVKKVKSNSCGYASFKLIESLTAFSTSYEINIYSVQGVKLSNIPERDKPNCRKGKS